MARNHTYFRLVRVRGLVQPLNNLSGALYLSQARTGEFAFFGVILSGIPIIAFFVGLSYGVLGVAAAYALAETLKTPLAWWAATRSGPVRLRDITRTVEPNAISMAASFAAVFSLHHFVRLMPRVATLLGASVSYFTTMLVLGLFDSGRRTMRDL
jgi:PST family polysaccharide transporter